MRMALGAAAVAACVALAGCSSQDGVEGAVAPVELPANLCDAVPRDLVVTWSLTEDSHDVDNGDSLATASCRMSGPDADLDLSVTSLGGASAASAERFAGEEQVDRCASIRSLGGDYTDSDASCATTVDDAGTTTVASVEQVVDSHGVTRVEMTAPSGRAGEVNDAVNTLLDELATVVTGD